MGLRRIPHFKRRFIPPPLPPPTPPPYLSSPYVVLGRIDNWQNWYSGGGREPRVRRLGTRVSPAAVASIFLAKLHPSPPHPSRSDFPSSAPRVNAYVVKPFFHYEIVTAWRKKRIMRRDRGNRRVFLCDLKIPSSLVRFMKSLWIRRRTRVYSQALLLAIDKITSRDIARFSLFNRRECREKKGTAATIEAKRRR